MSRRRVSRRSVRLRFLAPSPGVEKMILDHAHTLGHATLVVHTQRSRHYLPASVAYYGDSWLALDALEALTAAIRRTPGTTILESQESTT